jgi:hypothetical protein
MTTLDPWQELVNGLKLAEEMEQQRPPVFKEYRLYYNDDGTIAGLWETNHPEGTNYVVLENPDMFHKTNTNLLRVVNGELKIGTIYVKVNGEWEEVTSDTNALRVEKGGAVLTVINPLPTDIRQLYKSKQGYKVVKGHAAVVLAKNETYPDIEYYERTNN